MLRKSFPNKAFFGPYFQLACVSWKNTISFQTSITTALNLKFPHNFWKFLYFQDFHAM